MIQKINDSTTVKTTIATDAHLGLEIKLPFEANSLIEGVYKILGCVLVHVETNSSSGDYQSLKYKFVVETPLGVTELIGLERLSKPFFLKKRVIDGKESAYSPKPLDKDLLELIKRVATNRNNNDLEGFNTDWLRGKSFTLSYGEEETCFEASNFTKGEEGKWTYSIIESKRCPINFAFTDKRENNLDELKAEFEAFIAKINND